MQSMQDGHVVSNKNWRRGRSAAAGATVPLAAQGDRSSGINCACARRCSAKHERMQTAHVDSALQMSCPRQVDNFHVQQTCGHASSVVLLGCRVRKRTLIKLVTNSCWLSHSFLLCARVCINSDIKLY